ncbi:DUF1284 domain-containing protein [Paraclostridium sordellii]|uniref:DUF1284 domain-containing protein n=1 Tax=Paraclostridium sordellii TaxID=1505 RepID=UPI0005DC8238|nr:DUF1284 domain-containing protein [Paeniclostridium sordellii]CEN26931.1 Protein of uncharacterised function (DUF1284) [[Clostridium] sordellii] [Paeniclostridium sordellii]CEP41041.1 Protein of uncharacterised function (DUF1284) [[Clostridium] sordellii] [Paeniclostridium sordellii]
MLEIRPHHFLCMKAFIGKGYSKEFVENMRRTIEILKNDKNQTIKIIYGLDNLCSKCPNNTDEKLCSTNEKVMTMDKKVMDYFNIDCGEYKYDEIMDLIYNNINEEILQDICGNCNWYNQTNCNDLILL